jgi:hypothetical protein
MSASKQPLPRVQHPLSKGSQRLKRHSFFGKRDISVLRFFYVPSF